MARKKGLAGVVQQTRMTEAQVKKQLKRIENMPGVRLGKYVKQDRTPTVQEFWKYYRK